MLDRIHVTQAPSYPQYVKHDHHHAPTDESVKLMKDMEQKVLDNITDRFIFEDNELKGSIFVHKNPLHLKLEAHAVFTLNGKEYSCQVEVDESFNKKDAWQLLCKKVSETIAAELFRHGLEMDRYTEWDLNRK